MSVHSFSCAPETSRFSLPRGCDLLVPISETIANLLKSIAEERGQMLRVMQSVSLMKSDGMKPTWFVVLVGFAQLSAFLMHS
jgi:hypothetical protein